MLCAYYHYSEVLKTFIFFQDFIEPGVDLWLLSRVPQISPKFLQAVQLALVVVLECLSLELFVQIGSELALKAVAVEPEQALQAVAEAVLGVLCRQLAEVVVHLTVEVVA